MKKILSILAIVIFISSCTVIDPHYTGKRIVPEFRDDYDYSPSYGAYSTYGAYYNPYMWSGWYGWWNPFWLYGYYNNYGPYNPYFWGWYSSGYRTGTTGKSVITKRQLSKGTSRILSQGRIVDGTRRTSSSGSSRTAITRSGSSRSSSSGRRTTITRSGSSSRSSSARSRGSSSSGKKSTRVKK